MNEIVPHAKAGKAGTHHFATGFYHMNSDDELLDLAAINTKAPMPWRVWDIASARGNIWGHAEFAPGELRGILGMSSKRRDELNAAIGKLKAYGRVGPESTSQCIVLNAALYRRKDRARKHCTVHPGHETDFWVRGYGWAPEDEWKYLLETDQARHVVGTRRVIEREIRERIIEEPVILPVPAYHEIQCFQGGCTQPIVGGGMYCRKHQMEALAARRTA